MSPNIACKRLDFRIFVYMTKIKRSRIFAKELKHFFSQKKEFFLIYFSLEVATMGETEFV